MSEGESGDGRRGGGGTATSERKRSVATNDSIAADNVGVGGEMLVDLGTATERTMDLEGRLLGERSLTGKSAGLNEMGMGDDNEGGKLAKTCIISSAAKSSLRVYLEGVNWLLNKALPRGTEFVSGPLGEIVRQNSLNKTQVACQLLNYKEANFLNTQVFILLNPSNLDKTIHKGVALSTTEFMSSTLRRICNPDPSSYGSDFSNLCTVLISLPSTPHTYVKMLANSPDDVCFSQLAGVVENWIQSMTERISPKLLSLYQMLSWNLSV